VKWVLIAAAAITLEFATAWGLGRFIRAGAREMPPAPGDPPIPRGEVPAPGPVRVTECGPLSQCAREGHTDSLDHQPWHDPEAGDGT
jgi:hypothetical protein